MQNLILWVSNPEWLSEASNHAISSCSEIKKYYQRKLDKTMRVVALKTIANKLSKACYFILRDKVEFDMKKLFV